VVVCLLFAFYTAQVTFKHTTVVVLAQNGQIFLFAYTELIGKFRPARGFCTI